MKVNPDHSNCPWIDNYLMLLIWSYSNLELKKSMEKQIKEIRFMQICISKIILNKQVDLRESETLKHILKSARSPITSIEHFI